MHNQQDIVYREKPRGGAAPDLVTGQGTGGRIRIAVIIIFAAFLVLGLLFRGVAAAHAAASLFGMFRVPIAHAANSYLSDIEWGFDESETLYLKGHVLQDANNFSVGLRVGGTTLGSGVRTYAHVWVEFGGENIHAGEDRTFSFPYCTLCGWPPNNSMTYTRQSLADVRGLIIAPGDVAHISLPGDTEDDVTYLVSFWTGLKNLSIPDKVTQQEHQVDFSVLASTYYGVNDKLRFFVHEAFSDVTTTQDFAIADNTRTVLADHLTLPNGLYDLHPVLVNTGTDNITESELHVQMAVNDPNAPPPHFRNAYLSDVEWGFDESEVLYLKGHVLQDVENFHVGLVIGSSTFSSGVRGTIHPWFELRGENLSAGTDHFFSFPYCVDCGWSNYQTEPNLKHNRQSLADVAGIVLAPGDTARLSLTSQGGNWEDDTDYGVSFWTGLKNYVSPDRVTQLLHQVDFSLLYANYAGYDTLRFFAHEELSNTTTTQDIAITHDTRATLADHLTLPNGLYTLHPVLMNSSSGEMLESDIFSNIAVNDPNAPPPHFRNAYLSDVEWGFDESNILYVKASVLHDVTNFQVGISIGSTTVWSGVRGTVHPWFVLLGENISAGETRYFSFPYCVDCGWDNYKHESNLRRDRQNLTDLTGSTFAPGTEAHLAMGGGGIYWQDNTDYPITSSAKEPVIIVPGILGTEIRKGNELLWADIGRMVDPINSDLFDSFMDPLAFSSNLTPTDINLSLDGVLRKKSGLGFNYDYSEGLANLLTSSEIGYIEGNNLFTFPYDWRYGASNNITTQLRDKIDSVLAQTGANKVNVIAHSTGGLLVKKYIADNPSSHHIDKAIFLGVPNLGAPKAFKVLINGDNFGVPGLSYREMKKISQNMPVTYDLAPSREYVGQIGSFLRIVDDVALMDSEAGYEEAVTRLQNQNLINPLGIINGQSLHTAVFDNFDMRTVGVDIHNIIGCKTFTFGGFVEYVKSPSEHIYDFPRTTTGDGTVPLLSAQSIPADQNHVYFAPKADHGKMPSQDGIRQQIVNIITGSNLDTSGKILTHDAVQQNPALCQIKGEIIKIKSPVDVNVTDQLSNHSGLSEDGTIENSIPGADFQIWGEHKYVFLPTGDGEQYTITLKGTGTGTFTLQDETIDGDQTIKTQVFSNIPVTPSSTGQVQLGDTQTTLILDTDGNGTFDPPVQPSAIVNASQSKDITPPNTTSTISGTQGQPGSYRNNVAVTLTASDSITLGHEDETSGILSTQYSLDGGIYQTYTIPIAISAEGAHMVRFFSTDRAGNNELVQTVQFTIDKTAPEVIIQYDATAKKFTFAATDDRDTAPTIVCTTIQCTAKDRANNMTLLGFKQQVVLGVNTLTPQSVSYNGSTTAIKNTAFVGYSDSKGYDEYLLNNGLEISGVHYVLSKNQTTIVTYMNGKLTKQIVTGKRFLRVDTKRGIMQATVQ